MIAVLRTLNRHRAKLYLRAIVCIAALVWLAIRPDRLDDSPRVRVYHLLWGIGMLEMALVFFPRLAPGTSCGRVFGQHCVPARCGGHLRAQIRQANRRLWGVVAVWLLCIAALGSALWLKLVEKIYVVLAALLCSVLDQVFVNIWCPLRAWILKAKCCATCRIYGWGFAMMYSPLLFIPSFWTYSLLLMAAVILVRWEIAHARHPERFYGVSNKALRCGRCADPCRRAERVTPLPLPVKLPQERTGSAG